MEIDSTILPKFGTMTSGGGLSGLFDGNNATSGYSTSTLGYAGFTLSEPSRIAAVEITSPSNGFDASGSTSQIEIFFYGKNGAAPIAACDGIVLASIEFTDQNIQQILRMESADKERTFDHVWVAIKTGVWAVASEIKFYAESAPIQDIDPVPSGLSFIQKSCNASFSLPYIGVEIPQLRARFKLSERRQVRIDFRADVVHVGEDNDVDKVSGYSFRIMRRESQDVTGLIDAPLQFINNAVSGGNVSERNPQHYGSCSAYSMANPSEDPNLCGWLEAGYHEITVIGSGHSLLAKNTNLLRVLVERGMGLNCLIVTVFPASPMN